MLVWLVLHETSCFVNDCLIFSFVLLVIGFAGIGSFVADVDGDIVGDGGGGSGVGGVIDGIGNDNDRWHSIVGDAIRRNACIKPAVDCFGVTENDRKSL